MSLLEIEIKSQCESHTKIIELLETKNAQFVEKRKEVDQYYNHPARDFKQTDEALRIRVVNDKAILTYKGPKIGTKAKSRIEHECIVDNLEAMKNILLPLGFVESGCVRKTRTLYKLDTVEICLDDVEGLGQFVELEEIGIEREKIEEKLFKLAAELGLDSFILTSYLEMVLEKSNK